MPKDRTFGPFGDMAEPVAQADYLSDAFETGDPLIIGQALKDISTLRRVPCALDDNPLLGEVLRVIDALGLRLVVKA